MFFGLDSVLDFRLAEGRIADDNNAPLRDVLKGFRGPQTLFNRLEAQRQRASNRGEIGRYLVTFIDNHDGFWQPGGRFAHLTPGRTGHWGHRVSLVLAGNGVHITKYLSKSDLVFCSDLAQDRLPTPRFFNAFKHS